MSEFGAIVACRNSSTRLPGKALLHLSNHTILGLLIERLRSSKLIDKIVIATSVEPDDDEIERVGMQHGAQIFRGCLGDVLNRYARAADKYSIKKVIRLTADNPFIDGKYVDSLIKQIKFDEYTLYTTRPKCPKGLNVEVLSARMLLEADSNQELTSYDREHVTAIFYKQDIKCNIFEFSLNLPIGIEKISLSIDTPNDYKRAEMTALNFGSSLLQASVEEIAKFYIKFKDENKNY